MTKTEDNSILVLKQTVYSNLIPEMGLAIA